MFWRLFLGGSGTATCSEADANMQVWQMKVSIPFGGSLIQLDLPPSADSTEASRMEAAVMTLKHNVEPDSTVVVKIPLLVNHKLIVAQSKLQMHKVATDKKDKKAKPLAPLDDVGAWTSKRKVGAGAEDKPRANKKSK